MMRKQKKKSPTKIFNKIYPILRKQGWNYCKSNGLGSSWNYIRPGIEKKNAILDVDKFDEQGTINYLSSQPKTDETKWFFDLLEEEEEEETDDDDEHGNDDESISNDEEATSQKMNSMEFFNVVWPEMKLHGWTYCPGDLVSTWHYLPPGVPKKGAILHVNKFDGEGALNYIFSLERNESIEWFYQIVEREQYQHKGDPHENEDDDMVEKGSVLEKIKATKTKKLPPKPESKKVKPHNKKKQQQQQQQEKKSANASFSTTIQKSLSPGKIFNRVWPTLKMQGWTYFKGTGLSTWNYIPPKSQNRLDEVGVVNYLKSLPKNSDLDWFYNIIEGRSNNDYEIDEKHEEEDDDDDNDDEEEDDDNDDEEEQEQQHHSKNQSPLSFSKIWPKLQSHGWKYFPGTGLVSYYYALPHVRTKSQGILDVDMFDSEERVVNYYIEHGVLSSREEQQQVHHEIQNKQLTNAAAGSNNNQPSSPQAADADDETGGMSSSLNISDVPSSITTMMNQDSENISKKKESTIMVLSAPSKTTLEHHDLQPPELQPRNKRRKITPDEDDEDDGNNIKNKSTTTNQLLCHEGKENRNENDLMITTAEKEEVEEQEQQQPPPGPVITPIPLSPPSTSNFGKSLVRQPVFHSQPRWFTQSLSASLRRNHKPIEPLVSTGNADEDLVSCLRNVLGIEDDDDEISILSSELKRRWIGRHEQIDSILNILALDLPPSFLVYGLTATGKTSLIKDILTKTNSAHVIVNASECYSQSIIFRKIIASIKTSKFRSINSYEVVAKEEKKTALSAYEELRARRMALNAMALAQIGLGSNQTELYSSSSSSLQITSTSSSSSSLVENISLPRCETMYDFVLELKSLLSPGNLNHGHNDEDDNNSTPVFHIVLDEAEKIERMHPGLLQAFLQLSEMTSRKITVILISESMSREISSALRSHSVPNVFFQNYSQAEMTQILNQEFDVDEADADVRKNHQGCVNYLMKCFGNITNDLRELQYIVRSLWPVYSDERARKFYIGYLQRRIGRHDIPSPSELQNEFQKFAAMKSANHVSNSTTITNTQEILNHMEKTELLKSTELPFHSKVLLLASYIASYNTPEQDAVIFSNHGAGKAKKIKKTPRNMSNPSKFERLPQRLQGPRMFEIERLLLIFRSLLEEVERDDDDDNNNTNSSNNHDEEENYDNNISKQISSLISLNLLKKVSTDGELDDIKYKCISSFEYASAVAKNIQIDLAKYLASE